MRVLALDYGTARIGCAISDPSGTLATPLPVIEPPEPRSVAELVAEHGVELVVVGLPLHLGGEEGSQAALTRTFCAELESILTVPVDAYDERLTTRMAEASRREGAEASLDSLAAAHLLEAYLASRAAVGDADDSVGMRVTESWLPGDPFAEGEDPLAAERERRRRERAERREGTGGRQPRRSRAFPIALLGGAALVAVAIGLVASSNRSNPAPLTTGPITLTIPEGYDRAQTAQLAREDGLRGDYAAASVRSRYLSPPRYGGRKAKNLEGFLFPDTFDLRRHAPVSDLVQLQLEDFKRRIGGVDMGYARSKNLTTYDVVTIASMIEREAQLPGDRKLVAAVIYNRLRDGMPLGIDATIRFATGNYTRALSEAELATHSPYNTRLYTGLPPGPIDSPGLASIEAAAHPARVNYLYYVVKPGSCGKLTFSSSAARFERDVARYNSARKAAGGNSPTSCGK